MLDVGSGRRPSLPHDLRPPGCRWVAMDISASEVQLAAPTAYDSVIIADVEDRIPDLSGAFDLIVSWHALEHIRRMDRAVSNLHTYLRPTGRFVAMLSGRLAFFALTNRLVPHRVGVFAMNRLLGRQPETVFPAHYDQCTYSDLQQVFRNWHDVTVLPFYRGAGYLGFSSILQRAYISYENVVARKGMRDLATHYLISARR